MLATEYARYYKIEPQGKDESDHDFRGRVSGILRDMGNIIEAHEAFEDARYEDSVNVMTGVMGAVGQAHQNKHYGRSGERQVDDDFAAGVCLQVEKENSMVALFTALLCGR